MLGRPRSWAGGAFIAAVVAASAILTTSTTNVAGASVVERAAGRVDAVSVAAVSVAAGDLSGPAASSGLRPARRTHLDWRRAGYVVSDAGCAPDLSAQGLATFFRNAIGPVRGHDEPRPLPLGDGRVLWILQDSFIDYGGRASTFSSMPYVNNTALMQQGSCFTMLQGGTVARPAAFELGDAPVNFDRFFWPGGGTVSDGKIYIFWIEVRRDPAVGAFDGLSAHPVATWIGTYDAISLERLDFQHAPKSTMPVYGYGVADDGEWTYLFGNSDLQNLALDGGYSNGPHSATKMYLARVPRGRVFDQPRYWNGTGWSARADDAAPISQRFFTENLMVPVRLGGQWVSATKVDGFTGSTLTLDVADDPWGPWRTVRTVAANGVCSNGNTVTYHAQVVPWLDPSGAYIVMLSQIFFDLNNPAAIPCYRPNVFALSP